MAPWRRIIEFPVAYTTTGKETLRSRPTGLPLHGTERNSNGFLWYDLRAYLYVPKDAHSSTGLGSPQPELRPMA